ncbi:aldose 1-epimerase [Opitutus terrae]|uniref:Aldose 1-epimerase n=1 Tax=Opitutus terrae (strain DSM 11246 / JCM 15787 / PB90-1) TaxID=452637 RepID=B1ZUR1_OPITP|nr:aldose 1-epimerase [Opitutus terrae]ACB74945.1 Aldose 1-epimerase [Opitutus terrae PB90-1]
MESIDYHGHTLGRWRVGSSTFLALPERGARLMNWNLTLGDGSIRDVIYWPENADFDQFAKVRGGNPILFPFSARCFDRGEQNFWRGADGVRRPMPQHGFARQGTFKLVWEDARGFAAQLVPDAAAAESYPYNYEFSVAYRFEAYALSCELTLKNLGREPLPWSPGHHFYFTVPWSEGARREDYLIRIPAAERLRQAPDGQLVPGPHLRNEERLAEPALIDTLHTRLRSSEVVFGERGRPGDVIVRLGTAKVPPPDATFVTWTTDAAAPFYCVEPWMGPPNAPEHKRGLQWVAPRETGSFVVSVALK